MGKHRARLVPVSCPPGTTPDYDCDCGAGASILVLIVPIAMDGPTATAQARPGILAVHPCIPHPGREWGVR